MSEVESYFNTFLFGYYPYICMVVFLAGSLARFDRDQYTWKSDSSQLLRAGLLRWGSNFFHIGVLFLFFGHFVGLLTPHALYEAFMTPAQKQLLAIVAGEVTLGFNDVMTNLPQMRGGRLRGIAVTSLQRSSAVPELPTVAESGYPGFQSGVWYGVLAPARTPAEIVARLNAELVKIARSRDFQEVLHADGAVLVAGTPEQFGEFIRRETARWAGIIKAANITGQ